MKRITPEQFSQEKNNDTYSQADENNIDETVLEIIKQVKKDGNEALYRFTEQFDGIKLKQLAVTKDEFIEAKGMISDEFKSALEEAKANITAFHEVQKEYSWFTDNTEGIMLGQKVTPLEKVGVYVPGGKASYPSTVLMNVIPAKLAGVKKIVITTPPDANGKISPEVLAAAEVVGVDEVYKLGGAQAIAALAYGTSSIEKVTKIVGPGNAFVARAKKWVYGDVAIDMIAGPSEICVVADESAPADYIAADLLSQAEHDEQSTSICITTSESLATEVQRAIDQQTTTLDRKDIIEKALTQNGRIIVVKNIQEAFNLVNEIAPEHLQLMIENATEKVGDIQNAGAVFLGNFSPEPLGDYFAGPNHTLPTSGTAAFSSPLGVYDFMKKSSIIRYSRDSLLDASENIITLAKAEGLSAHANSIQIRKDNHNA
ncbi:histidinol dehydrogenase [Virgibacillus subterraneus]|uniref:Histidinol dehydrogenase n=1 Tax=Virgibacillus subterraneus TaxID=621109 RepID=A0A1H9ILB2_9BACI|nr:histidinol dehydrogenase [Virgibacillus subterraneus]SEQ75327.1 histidinol dehydrogenase [Virgibacillus subterraneus]